MKKFTLLLGLVVGIITIAAAQSHDKHDASIKITVDGKEVELEDYIEEWTDQIETITANIESHNIDVNIDFDEEEFEIAMEKFGDSMEEFGKALGEYGEELGEKIEEAVNNMSIELHDIDPDDVKNNRTHYQDDDLEDVIEEIESKYNSDVEWIDRMYIKLEDGDAEITLDFTLENGKKIRNYKYKETR